MNTTHLDIEDELIEEAFDREWITDWDRTFMLGLVDYSELSEKQEIKYRSIIKKIERGQKRNGAARATACPHCGHAL